MNAPTVFSWIFMVGGTLFVIGGVEMIFRRRGILSRGVPVTGQVSRLMEHHDADGHTTVTPVVTYQTEDGAAYEFRFLQTFPGGRWAVGDAVELIYDSAKPSVAMPGKHRWGELVLSVVMGTICFSVGAALKVFLGENGTF